MIYPEGDNRIVARDLDAMILSNARKLIRALGEELIGQDDNLWVAGEYSKESIAFNALRAEQRLKLKEILSNIK